MLMRSFFVAAIATLAAMGALPSAAAPGGPPIVRRAVVAEMAADGAAPLVTCDVARPELGFTITNLQLATIAGFNGTVIQGTVINQCSTAVQDVRVLALVAGSGSHVVGATATRADFGVLGPGQGSPFVAAVPEKVESLANVGLIVTHFAPVSGPAPSLELKKGTPSFGADGVSVPYQVRNTGTAVASLPRIAGRLIGSGCTSPAALEFLVEGAPIPVGGSVTGTLFIPGGCGGYPQVDAGSDFAPPALPAGLSFAEVRAFYLDGVLHLVANVCNGSSQEAFLPQLRVQFSGGTAPTFTLAQSGIYSGMSCAPLIATIPGAPAGLTDPRLLQPGASAAGAASPLLAASPRADLPLSVHVPRDNSECDDEVFLVIRLAGTADLSKVHPECRAIVEGMLDLYTRGSANLSPEPPHVFSFVYNGSGAALPSGAYRIQALGHDKAGQLIAGIDVASPPSVGPRSWGISDTSLDEATVIGPPGELFRADGEGFAIPK
ncbi:MAG: hypothetical protein ABI577_02885 [bacterium]